MAFGAGHSGTAADPERVRLARLWQSTDGALAVMGRTSECRSAGFGSVFVRATAFPLQILARAKRSASATKTSAKIAFIDFITMGWEITCLRMEEAKTP
ncbi:hypothetical protein CLV41_10191 [Roseibium marinum]|uniref:Uncharacterized protein n=1 Tax=Roseibium marinum TaxID=281252 RepID=A0A2S3V0Z3_9HYPH|nr:hypothetical protein CLV41_10191 [Roseibium marinum]